MTEDYQIQRSPAWFSWRRAHLGASEASAVLGISPWKSALELYNEKIALDCAQIAPNYAMRRGVELEPLALAKFESETGYLMTPRVLTHPKYEFLSASLDGLELEGSCAVEIKCSGKVDHDLALKGKVPEKYMPQLQHIMEVTQLQEMYYMSYVSDSDFTIFKVQKDNEYTDKLLQAELEFWKRVQDRNPPEPTDRDSQTITSPEWLQCAEKWSRLQEAKNELERQENELRKEIIALADYKSATGHKLKLTKSVTKGRVDYTTIPALIGVDLEKYRKPSTETWRITLQGDEE